MSESRIASSRGRTARAKGQAYASRVASAAGALKPKLERIRGQLVEVHSHADEITLHYPIRYYNMLLSLAEMVQSGTGSITQQEPEIYAKLAAGVDAQLAALRGLETGELTAFNTTLRQLDVPSIIMEPASKIVP